MSGWMAWVICLNANIESRRQLIAISWVNSFFAVSEAILHFKLPANYWPGFLSLCPLSTPPRRNSFFFYTLLNFSISFICVSNISLMCLISFGLSFNWLLAPWPLCFSVLLLLLWETLFLQYIFLNVSHYISPQKCIHTGVLEYS